MKRAFLFLITNLAVIFVMSVVLSLLGVNHYLYRKGLDFGSLLVFSFVFGFTGAIISLLMSKRMAKWSTGAYVIHSPSNETEQWLLNTINKLSTEAKIKMPEVAVYEGEPNAFATGAFKNSALVAVSTGLLRSMNHEEVEAVLGHEITHIANGDMVTLTLIQGVLNTFVIFLARVVGFVVDNVLSKNSENGRHGMGYFFTVMICEVLFGILASIIVAWFSRYREFRADAGSAKLLGNSRPMIHALQRLGHMSSGDLPKNMMAMGINSQKGFMSLFATHPPIEKRIEALQTAHI